MDKRPENPQPQWVVNRHYHSDQMLLKLIWDMRVLRFTPPIEFPAPASEGYRTVKTRNLGSGISSICEICHVWRARSPNFHPDSKRKLSILELEVASATWWWGAQVVVRPLLKWVDEIIFRVSSTFLSRPREFYHFPLTSAEPSTTQSCSSVYALYWGQSFSDSLVIPLASTEV